MSDDRLTLHELREGLTKGSAIAHAFSRIKERIFDLSTELSKTDDETAALARHYPSIARLVADAVTLIALLEDEMHDNERNIAFLLGLEEAGTISRAQLEFLMGLRDS